MSSDLQKNWIELSRLLASINITITSCSNFQSSGYVTARGDTWNYRTILQKLGFKWRRSDRSTIITQDVFSSFDYSKIIIASLISEPEARSQILLFINQIQDENLKLLVSTLINNTDLCFFLKPAASTNHHAYIHGLAEHTLQVVNSAVKMADCYPFAKIDLDLVIAGSLLHDIGKTLCYQFDGEDMIAVTPSLSQMGHVAKGAQIITETNQQIDNPLAEDKIEQLLHIVLSHQLLKEWESPIEPQIPEAWLVYCADQLSSKLGGMLKYQ